MKFIRWPGLMTFVVFLGALIGGSLLFAGPVIESVIESTWTKANQAQVDVGSVDVSYSPFTVTVNDIQVTDPNQPMINSVQIAKAHFGLSFGDLLLKKVIIDDMSLSGIRVGTPRSRSGALRKPVVEEQDTGAGMLDKIMPDIDLPSAEEVIAAEQLNSQRLVDELKQDMDSTQNQWSKMRDDIADKKRWDALRARYDNIRNEFRGDTKQKLAAIEDAKQLRKDIKAEVERIRVARRTINQDSERLQQEYKAAKAAPGEDIARIKQKYRLDDLSAGNVTELILGEKTAEYLRLAQTWYARVRPYIKSERAEPKVERSEGEFIKYREFNPKPGFYVRNASLDAQIPRGEFVGRISDISSDQTISKKPTRFSVEGQNMRHRDGEKLSGEFNYVDPQQGFTRIDYGIKNYQLNELQLSKSEKLALTMQQSLMSMQVTAKLHSGRLDGNADARFNKVKFASSTGSSGALTQMLSNAFSNVHQFRVDAVFSGKIRDLDIDMKSDLDNQIGREFKVQINQRKQQFEQKLRARIDEKLREPMAKVEATRQRIDSIKTELDNYQQEFDQKLADLDNKIEQEKELKKQKLDNKLERKKDELKNRLLDKLRG